MRVCTDGEQAGPITRQAGLRRSRLSSRRGAFARCITAHSPSSTDLASSTRRMTPDALQRASTRRSRGGRARRWMSHG